MIEQKIRELTDEEIKRVSGGLAVPGGVVGGVGGSNGTPGVYSLSGGVTGANGLPGFVWPRP